LGRAAPDVFRRPPPGGLWNRSARPEVPRLEMNAVPRSGAPRGKGSAMYSIFYIIGVIVVILAVLQLIA
jgi:hypothetical protein